MSFTAWCTSRNLLCETPLSNTRRVELPASTSRRDRHDCTLSSLLFSYWDNSLVKYGKFHVVMCFGKVSLVEVWWLRHNNESEGQLSTLCTPTSSPHTRPWWRSVWTVDYRRIRSTSVSPWGEKRPRWNRPMTEDTDLLCRTESPLGFRSDVLRVEFPDSYKNWISTPRVWPWSRGGLVDSFQYPCGVVSS